MGNTSHCYAGFVSYLANVLLASQLLRLAR